MLLNDCFDEGPRDTRKRSFGPMSNAGAEAVTANGEERLGSKDLDGGTSHSDQDALVDVPLSFELSRFETLPSVNRGIINGRGHFA